MSSGNLQSKICKKCNIEKPLTDFHKSSGNRSKGGVRARCKKCLNAEVRISSLIYYGKKAEEISKLRKQRYSRTRDWYVKKFYGITMDDYWKMFAEQKGLCAICKQPPNGISRGSERRYFSIDHNHKTGKVRNLLCNTCNLAVGSLLDDPDTAQGLINYLEKWKNG